MKYLVLSDSHGNVDNMVRAVELVKPHGIIHLGDGWRDVEELRELFPSLPLEQVPGNCDFGRFEALERVLILDDSTSAVDTATDAKIRRAFAQRIPGTTKIIIAQRISSVQDADRIIVMDNGRVEAFDTHENLLKKSDLYREIYETQTSGGGDFDSPDQMKGGDAQ